MMKKTLGGVKTGGFTLVELLVVVAIIGLLATLSVLALGSARVRARDAKRLADIKTVQTALELYNNDQGGYPSAPAAGLLIGDPAGAPSARVLTSAGWEAAPTGSTTYLPTAPDDPLGSQNYVYNGRVSSAPGAAVCSAGQCASYVIQFTLEGPTAGLAAGATCARPPSTLQVPPC